MILVFDIVKKYPLREKVYTSLMYTEACYLSFALYLAWLCPKVA